MVRVNYKYLTVVKFLELSLSKGLSWRNGENLSLKQCKCIRKGGGAKWRKGENGQKCLSPGSFSFFA